MQALGGRSAQPVRRTVTATHQQRRRTLRPTAFLQNLLRPFSAGAKTQDREDKKEQLLSLIEPLQRGVAATPEDQEEVDAACRQLERLNPNPKTLASPLVNGKWKLLYTSSQSILGGNRPAPFRPWGPIYQFIDAVNLRARNAESAPFFNQVSAELTPVSGTKVAVQFKQFRLLNLIPITAPESAKGELDITYVDEDLRISRGDKGNLFVLQMADRDARP